MNAKDLLEQLNTETGLTLSLSEEDLAETSTSEKLQQLLDGVTRDRAKDDYFQQFLLGQLSREEAEAGRIRYHIEEAAFRTLFLIAFKAPFDELSLSVLSSLETGSDRLIEMDPHHIVLIRRLRNPLSEDELSGMASSVLDALGSEAMQAVRVSYDRCAEAFDEIPLLYKHAEVALHLGVIFKNGKRIHSYHDLSLEKLMYSVPGEDAREYLTDNLSSADISALDNEMRSTIKALFQNQLNLADTAKDLYIHRNTLVYRLDKIQKLTGLDLRKFDDAVCCKVALILSEYTK